MRVIETTAHVGPDGILRLALPTDQPDQDVKVAVVVEGIPHTPTAPELDRWADVRQRLEAAGMRVPPPGVDNTGRATPQDLPGPSASEMLIRDRR